MSRQAGKNELSAHVEATLMRSYYKASRPDRNRGIKAAPTQNPQAVRSLERLSRYLRACRYRGVTAGGDVVRYGDTSWWFGSGEPEANVVGDTANLLLEIDEAQDFDPDKFQKDYAPMTTAEAAATVFYGTAWSDFDLLEQKRQYALELEQRDGRRRVFDVPWWRVAEENPNYAVTVENQRRELGHTEATPHPIFRTQYELVPMAGAGRLFSPEQLRKLQGEHPPLAEPQAASLNVYVAGLDIGGANVSGADSPDETVLTIGRARFPGRGQTANASVDVVAAYRWRGVDHDTIRGEVFAILTAWRVVHVAIDGTGIGEPMAVHLQTRLGARAVTILKVTRELKSSLGHDLLASVNTNALKLWKPKDQADELHAMLSSQARLCRSEYKAGKLLWSVEPRDGHDDGLFSLALLVRAGERGRPRVATMSRFNE